MTFTKARLAVLAGIASLGLSACAPGMFPAPQTAPQGAALGGAGGALAGQAIGGDTRSTVIGGTAGAIAGGALGGAAEQQQAIQRQQTMGATQAR